MTEINYAIGDATAPYGNGVRFIAHVCNNRGGWGRGFVVALSERNKNPEDCYRRWHKDGMYEFEPFELGSIQTVRYTAPDVMVVNMIAQDGIRSGSAAPRVVDYYALRACMAQLGEEAMRWWAASKITPSIHMPRIGCGLGGGDWAAVEAIILGSLIDVYGLSVTVYDLPGTVPVS